MLQRRGIESVISALENDEATLVLLERENDDTRIDIIRQLCDEKGVKIEEGSQRDIWRMATPAKDGEPEHAIALALVGREPNLPLTDVFANGGLIWLLDGVQYATNMGFCIRTAEVSGANAVVVSNKMNHAERSAVKGSSMKATRFIPVHYTETGKILELAKENGFRIVVAEDVGTIPPWEANLEGDILVVVGAEREGVSQETLEAADEIVRLPMNGFIPSYNLQVAMSCLAIEAIRQRQ